MAAVVRATGASDGLARLLVGRGVAPDKANTWLRPVGMPRLPGMSSVLDLDRAVALLADAVTKRRRIGILGDYDVDGAASTAQLVRYLRAAGVTTITHVPDRIAEGYGPSTAAIDRFQAARTELVVTVDCGITAFASLRYAAERRIRVIVVDHHVAEAELPAAAAIVNPNRGDDTSGLGMLTSSGLTWLLISRLHRELGRRGVRDGLVPEPESFLDLAALGTVCDLAPLTGANRDPRSPWHRDPGARRQSRSPRHCRHCPPRGAPAGIALQFRLRPPDQCGRQGRRSCTGLAHSRD